MENKSFEIPNYENKKGYQELSGMVNKRKEVYEKMSQRPEEKEIVREVIDDIFDKKSSVIVGQKIDNSPQSIFDEAVSSNDGNTVQILEDLVNSAFDKGVSHAIMLSRKTSNLYIMDKFHDMLVDRFYELLKNKNKIKN